MDAVENAKKLLMEAAIRYQQMAVALREVEPEMSYGLFEASRRYTQAAAELKIPESEILK